MKQYLGVLVLLIGALILIYTGFNPSYDSNTLLGTGLLLVVLGYIAHIFLNRSTSQK